MNEKGLSYLKSENSAELDFIKNFNQAHLYGVWWTMKDLEVRTNKKQAWLKKHILMNPKYKEVLDVKNNGGFVYYPKKGQQWSFDAFKMAEFLHNNFAEIHKQF